MDNKDGSKSHGAPQPSPEELLALLLRKEQQLSELAVRHALGGASDLALAESRSELQALRDLLEKLAPPDTLTKR